MALGSAIKPKIARQQLGANYARRCMVLLSCRSFRPMCGAKALIIGAHFAWYGASWLLVPDSMINRTLSADIRRSRSSRQRRHIIRHGYAEHDWRGRGVILLIATASLSASWCRYYGMPTQQRRRLVPASSYFMISRSTAAHVAGKCERPGARRFRSIRANGRKR